MYQEQVMGDRLGREREQEQVMGDRLWREREHDSTLERELEEGEQLLWFGRGKKGSQYQAVRVLLILTIVFGSIGLPLLLVGSIFSKAFPAGSIHILGLIFAIIGGGFLITTFVLFIVGIALRLVTSDQLYAITDQRIIVIRKGVNLVVKSYTKNDIGPISRIERPDGSGDLFFSKDTPPYSAGYSGRNYSYTSGTSTSNWSGWQADGFVGVANVHDIERILRRNFKEER